MLFTLLSKRFLPAHHKGLHAFGARENKSIHKTALDSDGNDGVNGCYGDLKRWWLSSLPYSSFCVFWGFHLFWIKRIFFCFSRIRNWAQSLKIFFSFFSFWPLSSLIISPWQSLDPIDAASSLFPPSVGHEPISSSFFATNNFNLMPLSPNLTQNKQQTRGSKCTLGAHLSWHWVIAFMTHPCGVLQTFIQIPWRIG